MYWYDGDLVVQSGVTISPPSNPAVQLMGTVNTLNNFGTLSGSGFYTGITNTFNINSGIVNQSLGSISTISNIGTIGPFTSNAIFNQGYIGLIDNVGQIIGNSNGITNTNSGLIDYIANNYLIQGNYNSGIVNYGTINTFSNNLNASLLGYWDFDPAMYDPQFPRDYGASFRNLGGTVGSLENRANIGFNSMTWPTSTSFLGIYNTGTINQLSNLSVFGYAPASIVGTASAIYNDGGTIELLTNSADSAMSSNVAIFNTNNGASQGRIGTLDNQGVIEGDASYGSMGIRNDGRIDSLVNINPGIIRGSSAIFNNTGASLGAIDNSGSIEGFYEYGIQNLGTITTIDNSLRITGPTAGIQNDGDIGAITNTGKIGVDSPYMASSNYGIINSGGTINAITNSTLGSSIAGTSSGVLNDVLMGWGFTTGVGYIGNINNQGVIAGNTNYGIDNLGRIDSIHNQAGASIQSNSDPSGRSGIFNHRSFFPLASLDLRPSGSIGTILNENTITGYVAGIENEGDIALIDNQSTGRIEGSSGIRNTDATVDSDVQAATITLLKNAGEILGTNLNGVPGDAGIYNKGTITALENLSGGIIASPLYGIYNDTEGTFNRIDNSGSIASNISGGEAALYNAGTITSFINRDTGYVGTLNPWNFLTASIFNTGGGLIANLDNYGKIGDEAYPSRIPMYGIRNNDWGFINPNRIGTLRNFGTIDGETGIQNGVNAQIEILTNASGARITGSAAYAIANNGSISTLTNQGTLSGFNSGILNDVSGTIDSLENTNSITGGTSGIRNDNTSFNAISSITNTGVITGGYGIENYGSIGTIFTNNQIIGTSGAGIYNQSMIGAITYDLASSIAGTIFGIDNNSFGSIGSIYGFSRQNSGVVDGLLNTNPINTSNPLSIRNDNTSLISSIYTIGIYNTGTINQLSNTSTINLYTSSLNLTNDNSIGGIYTTGIYNTGTISLLNNSGTIRADISDLDLTNNSGFITQTNGFGIQNSGNGVINSITNSGSIAGTSSLTGFSSGIRNDSTAPNAIGTITNTRTGSITGATGIDNYGSIGTINNSNQITGTTFEGINNIGTINTINADATSSITGASWGIYNSGLGSINVITNNGSISGATAGILNDNTTPNAIGTITNAGTITGASGIENNGSIGTIDNFQGSGSGAGPLSIRGNLPDTYQIGITSLAQYGQLNTSGVIAGSMGFGIAPGSTMTLNTTYNAVLGGFDASNIRNFSTTYDGWLWTLESQTLAGGIWKLTFPTIGPGMTATTSQLGSAVNPYFTGGSLQLGLSETVSSNFVLDGSGIMIAPSSGSATVSGVMSGSGSLTISGPGSLVLSGNNTYTGATTINPGSQLALLGSGSIAQSSVVQVDGVLDISATTNGASIQSLAGSGTTALGNQNLTISNASSTYAGVITGTGGVTVSGGAQQFAGSNTYTGTTAISSGSQLALLGGGSIAQSSVVQVDGSLDISATTSGASIQSLAGSGNTALGNQNLRLSNASSNYAGAITGTGGVTVSGGVQQLSGTNTYSGGTTVQNATLWINADAALGNASANVQLSNGTLKTTESFSASRPVILQGSGNAIDAGLGASVVLDGALSGAGALAKQGEGRLVVNGVSTNTGDVTVAAGTLKVGQSEAHTTARLGGNVAVQAGALLQGHGMVAGSVTSTGTVQPGGSIGTLTIAGNYTQTSSGTLQSDVTPTANSVLNVLGDATIAGGLVINAQSGTYSRKTYTLLSSNRLTGQFGTINTNLASNIRYQINYDAQNVYFEITSVGPSTADTQSALNTTANYLQSSLILQNAVLVNSLGYDCTVFDLRGICISVGGRNTTVQAREINNTSGLLIAAYRVAPQWRIGLFADQNLSASNPSSYVQFGNATPLVGAFAAWSENSLGTGWEVRMAGAYGQKSVNITRPVVGTSEAGSGSSNLTNQGVQATVKYSFPVAARWTVSPYAGMRYTQSTVGAYTETTSATVAYPLSYNAVQSNATTALAGLGVTYQPRVDLTFNLSGGLESDTNTSAGNYVASNSNIPNLTPISMNLNPVKTRPTALVGASYAIEKNHVLGITGIYRQEPYKAVSSTTVLATYTIGL
ncbi:hypothetical protein PHIN6_03220 [Polynucleobacter sp. HIN6]|nr:hypothetical protein PHIN6_03220 [Polynucleobacter sp. HIN6]